MIAVKPIDVRAKLKDYFDMAFNGETVIVSRRQNKNVVIISEAEYNKLDKARKNAEYLSSLQHSIQQFEEGKTVQKTMDELLAMENDL